LIGEVTLLDQDFDDVDEMLIFDPPVRCIRGGHVTLVDKDPEDGPEE
jgi:hypothetical protein